MHFPKFWAQGSVDGYHCWGWSDISNSEALAKAQSAARKIAAAFSSGTARELSRYGYGTRLLREEVISENKNPTGEILSVISRNAHGCLVLNTKNIMFLDVDTEPSHNPSSKPGFFASLFGKKNTPQPDFGPKDPIEKLKDWVARNHSWGVRAYKTAGGYRFLMTHTTFDPNRIESERICDAIGVDKLYRKLCVNQESFRARLTPKYWRCGIRVAPPRWPLTSEGYKQAFKTWQEKYANACEKKATCEFIEHFGSSSVIPEAQAIIELHDQYTKALSHLPLA